MRDEQRFEYTNSLLGAFGEDRSCESIKAIFSRCAEGSERKAERRESPAGPPPMQTRSYISGLDEDAVVLYNTRRNAGGRCKNRCSNFGEAVNMVGELITALVAVKIGRMMSITCQEDTSEVVAILKRETWCRLGPTAIESYSITSEFNSICLADPGAAG